jgi:tRNA pseudouridine65 synthase
MPPASDTPNSRPPIPILHLDEGFVAVSKPGGLLVHRTKESTDRVFLLQELRNQLGRHVFPVHRLDRGASGAMLLAFTGEDARLLQQSLESPEALKEYLVLVRGSTSATFEVDRPLRSENGTPQAARTAFVKIAEFSRLSLLRARIFTGRRHQIRRHLSHEAHQVLGDTSHGKGRINQFFRDTYGLPRLCLHAARLELTHPRTAERLVLNAPLPDDLRSFLERLPDCPRDIVDRL